MKPAVRLTDIAFIAGDGHCCPACVHACSGPVIGASGNVNVNSLPAARKDDPGIHAACCGPNTYVIAQGSSNVFINGKPAARFGDKTTHCGGSGKLVTASPNVYWN